MQKVPQPITPKAAAERQIPIEINVKPGESVEVEIAGLVKVKTAIKDPRFWAAIVTILGIAAVVKGLGLV